LRLVFGPGLAPNPGSATAAQHQVERTGHSGEEMFTNPQRQVERTGRGGTPRDQYLQVRLLPAC
jgi:ribosomal protein L44E